MSGALPYGTGPAPFGLSRDASQAEPLVPSAGILYRSEPYAMTTIDTGRDAVGAPLAEVWTFASEDDYVIGEGWLEVAVHEVVPTEKSGTLAVYYRQWFAPDGEPAWGNRPKRTVGSLASLKSLIRRRKMTAQGMAARSDETPQEVRPEGQQPGGEAMRPENSP